LQLEPLILDALSEDLLQNRDFTSDLFVDDTVTGNGWIEARQNAVVSGLSVARAVFEIVDPTLHTRRLIEDGKRVRKLERVLEISGKAGSILRAERTALNFLCHLSGVATYTSLFVEATRKWGTKILCTRKTTPALRDFEVAAVRHGGGDAYRTNLSDSVLLKDNHIGIVGGMAFVRRKVDQLRKEDPALLKCVLHDGKIEVGSLHELDEAVDMGWQQILLDNFEVADAEEAVRRYGARVFLEISGGVNLKNVADFAATGVHAISVGAITHSSRAVDFSLEVEWRHE
jgi:nicotinate-nucleotide pyrophosphorylase (carboxylating)